MAGRLLDALQHEFTIDSIVPGYIANDAVQRSNAQGFVIGNGDAMGCRYLRLENNVAADLMDFGITLVATQVLGEITAAQVAGGASCDG